MEIWVAIILLIVGFVCLVKGADWFVDGAAGIAEKITRSAPCYRLNGGRIWDECARTRHVHYFVRTR